MSAVVATQFRESDDAATVATIITVWIGRPNLMD
jgi:hypothetical protein